MHHDSHELGDGVDSANEELTHITAPADDEERADSEGDAHNCCMCIRLRVCRKRSLDSVISNVIGVYQSYSKRPAAGR
jgi:hypothetical protein